MSNHADRLFSMGSLIGVRSFGYNDQDKRLHGPVYKEEPFQPGTNLAVCGKESFRYSRRVRQSDIGPTINQVIISVGDTKIRAGRQMVTASTHGERIAPGGIPPEALGLQRMMQHLLKFGIRPSAMGEILRASGMTVETVAAPVPVNLVHEKREHEQALAKVSKHEVGQLGCTCGYYAYFDRRNNSHHQFGNVLGLIEGFGVTTVGERGFRASKARLVAVVGTLGDTARHKASYEEYPGSFYSIDGEPVSPGTEFVPRWLPEVYSVPVFKDLDTALREYPLTNPHDVPEIEDED